MPDKGPGSPIGYHYHLGIVQHAFSGPIDAVLKIIMDEDKSIYDSTKTNNPDPEITATTTIDVDLPELFGGDDREGGIVGKITVALGYASQLQNAYLQAKLDPNVSAYRGLVSLIWEQTNIGNHYFLKTVWIKARRLLISNEGNSQWLPEYVEPIPGEMNGVHIIREKLTNMRNGCREPVGKIDDVSFTAAAITCYNEGLGFSFINSKPADEFIKEVLEHMNARLFEDTDGLYKIKLFRNDYVISELPVYQKGNFTTPGNIVEVQEYTHTSIDKLYTGVKIKYWDEKRIKEDQITINSPGLEARLGSVRVKTISYMGASSRGLAYRLGQRELAAASVDLPTIRFVTTRSAGMNRQVGDVIVVNYTNPDINSEVFRITSLSLGTITDNKVTISAIKDVFTTASPAFFEPQDSAWVDPVADPDGVQRGIVMETPYYVYAKRLGDVKAQAVAIDTSFISCAGATPVPSSGSAKISYDAGLGYITKGKMYYCPTCVLQTTMSPTTTSISVNNTQDWDLLEVDSFIQFDEELMKIVSFTNSTMVVARGVLDTVPVSHSIGTIGFAWERRNGYIPVSFLFGETIEVKLRPTTPKGTLPLALAEINTIDIRDRFHRPYPPGNVKLNGVAFPTVTLSGTVTVSWSHRDRLAETVYLVDQTFGDIGPEAGTSYNLRLYSGLTLVREQNGLSSSPFNIIDTPSDPYYNALPNARIELESVRDGLTSMQKYSIAFNYGP